LGPVLLDGTELRSEVSERGVSQIALDTALAWDAIDGSPVVRITRHDRGDYVERRVMGRQRATLGAAAFVALAQLHPRLMDFADADLVREFTGGRWVYAFDITGTIRELLQRLVFTNMTEDGLSGIVLGSAPDVVRYPIKFNRWTRLQVLDELLRLSFGELVWSYRPDGLEQLDIVEDRGADAPWVPLAYGDRLARLDLDEDWQDVCTAYRLAGIQATPDGPQASFAENAWRVASVGAPSAGYVQVELREIDGTRSPILQDGMWASHPLIGVPACYVQRANGVTRSAVTASSKSASTVRLAAATAPVVNEIVKLVANADGDDLELIVLPEAVARFRRKIVGDQDVPGMRPERQYLLNGGHEDGLTGWTPVNGGVGVAAHRTELGREIVCRANGTRPPGTGTGTPLAVDGLTPITDRLLQGLILTQDGWSSAVDESVVPDEDGALLIPLASPTTADHDDGAHVTLERRETVTASIAEATPRVGGTLFLNVGDAALAQRLASFARLDTISSSDGVPVVTLGDVRLVGPAAETFNGELKALDVHEDDEEVVVARYSGFGGSASPPTAVVGCSNFAVLSAHQLRLYVSNNAVAGSCVVDIQHSYGGSNIPAWMYRPNGGLVLAVIGTVVATGTYVGTPYVDIEIIGAPAAMDLTGLVGYVVSYAGEGFAQYARFYDEHWAGSAALTWLRETRQLELDGDHANGSTALLFRPIAAIARRDWTSADELHTSLGDFDVTGPVSWNDDGTALVPCVIPSGVTLPALIKVWANWIGSGASDALLCVAEEVVGPASAVLLRGGDRFPNDWAGTTSPAMSVYLVTTDARVSVPGNTLVVAATVAANGSGQANVVLASANVHEVPNDAILRGKYPVMQRTGDREDGDYLRLLCATGSEGEPTESTPGWQSPLCYFRVPVGSTRTITDLSQFRLSMADWYAGQGPSVAIFSEAGERLAWAALGEDGITVEVEPGIIVVPVQAVINVSGRYAVRVYGGASDVLDRWCMHDQSMFYMGDATDAPYTRGSYPSEGLLRCARLFEERATARFSDVLEVEEFSTMAAAAMRRAGMVPPLVLGGRVQEQSTGRVSRVTAIVARPDVRVSRIEIGQVMPNGARILGEAALAADVGGLR
jgi:hypothetical protein